MAGQPLCLGDFICLYDEDKRGFIMSYQTSTIHNELSVLGDQSDRDFPVVPNNQAIVFQICVPQRYKCQKKVPKMEAMVKNNPSDIMLQSQLAHIMKTAENENNDNKMEQERQTGKQVLYGQTLQLKHEFTNKWIHVNHIHPSNTEHANMTVELKSQNSKSALFRIMPRSKVKTEGEVVQMADQIVLESIKNPASYLHISRFTLGNKFVCSDCYEVNISVRPAGLTIYRYYKPEAFAQTNGDQTKQPLDHKEQVGGGNFLRFYHREVEAYLTAEGLDPETGEGVHLRVRHVDPSNPKTMYPSTSAINYWQIEKESGPITGEQILWDELIRVRHAVNRMYLAATKEGNLHLVPHNLSNESVFRLHPVVKRDAFVTMETAVRIEHVGTGFWLNGHAEKPYASRKAKKLKSDIAGISATVTEDFGTLETIPWTSAERRVITAEPKMKYEDAFSIQIVEEQQMNEMNYVAGMVPFLYKFCHDISKGINNNMRQINKIGEAIKELRDYVFIDGVPKKRRQKLLRNFMIVDMAVQLLKFRTTATDPQSTDKWSGSESRSTKSRSVKGISINSNLEPIYSSLISLLSAYVNGESRKNELYLGRHMDFFLSQIEDTASHIGLTATQMTVDLLKNNRVLVDRITRSHIDKICNLIKRNPNYRYIDLLSSLCVCDGAALSRNQDYIALELLDKPVKSGRNVFLLTNLGQYIGRRKNAVYVSWDNGKGWQVLHDFTTQSFGTDYYLLLKHQLALYCSLCNGRNTNVVNLLVADLQIITWEECYICMTDKKLADEIRAIYCQLLYDLYVNVGTNFVQEDMKLVYNYEEIPMPKQRSKASPIGLTDTRPIELPFVEPLKLWINDFLGENDEMIASTIGRNQLIYQVLEVVRKMTLLGYYENFKDIKSVLDPIMGLLEGSDDLPYQVDNLKDATTDVKHFVELYQKEGRYKKNPMNAALVWVKIGACHATELLFNLRSAVRLNRFISEFKQICAQEDSNRRHNLGPLLHDNYYMEDTSLNQSAVNFLRKLFSETNYVASEFVQVGLDVCRYESEDLVAEAMFLLQRYNRSFDDMFDYAKQTQLLVTDTSRQVHGRLGVEMRELRLMMADKNIDAANGYRMRELLDGFTQLCYLDGDSNNECHAINQQILYNFGVLGDIFDIITGSIDTERDIIEQVYKSCFKLLMAMAHGNPTVQIRLFDRMGTFLKIEGVGENMAELFVVIFAGNTDLCLSIPPPLILELVSELTKTQSASLIRLLCSLVTINNVPLKRNQQLVIKALLQYKQSIEIVVETTPETRIQLLSADESKKGVSDKQRYICNIVQLLAYCSHGENKTVESICQTMFTLQELLDIILLPNLCNGLRGPFVQFLISVFFTSHLEIAEFEHREMSHEPRLWNYIESLSRLFEQITDDIAQDRALAKNMLKSRPVRLHVSQDNRDSEFKEHLHYIFDSALPFLIVFYHQFYARGVEDSNADLMDEEEGGMSDRIIVAEQQITERLLRSSLIPLVRSVYPCLSQAEHLQTLITCVNTLITSTAIQDVRPPKELNQPLQQSTVDPIVRYKEEYAEEIRLNMMLCHFVDNLRSAYYGDNTVQAQIGFPSSCEYCDLEGDTPLPLGSEFQDLVQTFVKNNAENPEEKFADVRCVIQHVGNSMNMMTHNERNRIRHEELNVRSLMILRALLHNEIVKMPEDVFENQKLARQQEDQIEETQNALVMMGLLESILSLLSSTAESLTREVLATLKAALHGGNHYVQNHLLEIFLATREEPFFNNIKSRMTLTEETLREFRMMATQKHADEKKMVKEMKKDSLKQLANNGTLLNDIEEIMNFDAPPKSKRMTIVGQAVMKASKMSRKLSRAIVAVVVNDEKKGKKKRSELRHDCRLSITPTGAYAQDVSEEVHLENSEYRDAGHLQLVLEVLAGMCDGQNELAQNYLRDQWDNLKTVDLVGETCDFLPLVISSQVNRKSIHLINQLIDTLIEMVQGNELNQVVTFDHKVLDNVNHILRMSDFPNCDITEVYSLKRSLAILIIDMTEENTISGHTKMIMEAVSKDDVNHVMLEAYRLLQNKSMLENMGEEDLVLNCGFLYHHILCRAFDLEPKLNRNKYTDNPAWLYFSAHTLSIELQKGDTLQRVYFTVEDKDVLRESVKERVKWEVDRSSPSNKLRDFMAWAKEVCDDIRYQRKVQSMAMGRWLVNNWTLLNVLMLLLTFIINLVVLFGWMAPEKFNTDYKYEAFESYRPSMSTAVISIVRALGGFHVIICALMLASFLLANKPTVPGYLKNAFDWIKSKIQHSERRRRKSEFTAGRQSHLVVNLFSMDGMYYPLLLLLSILGTFYDGEFFAFHMLHLVNQNQLLRRVIQAVTLNGRSMLWVCFLGAIFFYIYSLLGFLLLRNIYLGNQLYCHNLFECFISTIRNGLMFGMADHFDVPEDDPQNKFVYYAVKSVYDISFFALITTIGLNMIFGIIIDTFSQLREAKFQIEQDMRSNCFICNRQSYEFEHHAKGFGHHVHEEHSMWAYLFFFIHLSDTPTNDLTALELFVHNMIEEDGWEFFPLGRALTLSQWENDNADKRMEILVGQIDFLVQNIKDELNYKERAANEAAREAKKQVRESTRKTRLFGGKKKGETQMPIVHYTYGPFMYKLSHK